MGEIVNLRRVRKAKQREEAQDEAAARRAQFGRSKAERTAEAAQEALLKRTLDGAKREE